MKVENIILYGKKIRDILGFSLDFYISYLWSKYKARKTPFYIWQIEIPYALRMSLIEEQERWQVALQKEEELKINPDLKD